MKIKFRDFKGLYTNIDASDKPAEYFSKFKDIKVYPGYIESKGLKFEPDTYQLEPGHTFVRQQYVFLDEDKYQNIKVGGNGTEFTVEPVNDGLQVQGTETSNEEHHYFIKITRNDETGCFFEWHIDNQEPGEEIPISTTEFIPLINGLEIKFSRKYNRGKLWRVQSHITNVTELKNNYIQNIQKYLFQITYSNGKYYFWLDGVQVINSPFVGTLNQFPKIINEQGILKILMKEQALWIGKVNRSYWNGDASVTTILDGFYLYPLTNELNNTSSLFSFNIETSASIQTQVPIKTDYLFPYNLLYGEIAEKVQTIAYEIKDFNDITIPYDESTGLLHLVKFQVNEFGQGNIPQHFFGFWRGHTDIIPTPQGYTFYQGSDNNPMYPIMEDGNPKYFSSGIFRYNGIDSWVMFKTNPNNWDIPASLSNWLSDPNLKLNLTALKLDNYFDPGKDVEILTTIVMNNSEVPISFNKLSTFSDKFVVKISPNIFNIKGFYPNKISANIYFRYRDDITEVTDKDFEFCYGIQFINNKAEFFPKYIDKLTPNGIFLTQMIGKFFDPSTYKIITAFDDYSNVAGIPYILKNSNVHFPAVGGGSILNNFYYENVVPGIEGKQLIAFANLLGVFSASKELMTLIDFSPVESSMIFYIKDTLGYKIRDDKDVIETTEGTFIHLKEGIFVTNGRERTLISEQINNLVRANYRNASIFYNSYWKQLYYYTGSNLYCFDFETQSWCEYSLPEKELDKSALIDFIEDYEGNIFFISKDKFYKISFESKVGELELSYLDLQEYSISKRINYLVADHIGNIEATDISIANGSNRAVRYLFNKLDNRKPVKNIAVEVKFNGTLYGIELDVETIRTDQL